VQETRHGQEEGGRRQEGGGCKLSRGDLNTSHFKLAQIYYLPSN
jgi:hypothetical protein